MHRTGSMKGKRIWTRSARTPLYVQRDVGNAMGNGRVDGRVLTFFVQLSYNKPISIHNLARKLLTIQTLANTLEALVRTLQVI